MPLSYPLSHSLTSPLFHLFTLCFLNLSTSGNGVMNLTISRTLSPSNKGNKNTETTSFDTTP